MTALFFRTTLWSEMKGSEFGSSSWPTDIKPVLVPATEVLPCVTQGSKTRKLFHSPSVQFKGMLDSSLGEPMGSWFNKMRNKALGCLPSSRTTIKHYEPPNIHSVLCLLDAKPWVMPIPARRPPSLHSDTVQSRFPQRPPTRSEHSTLSHLTRDKPCWHPTASDYCATALLPPIDYKSHPILPNCGDQNFVLFRLEHLYNCRHTV